MDADRLDPRLRPYVEARSADEANAALDQLMASLVLPLARRIATHRLRGIPLGESPLAQEVDDVVASAALLLVERFQQLQDGTLPVIAQVESYVASVVRAACAHLLRERRPERTRLAYRLRYALTSDPALALWSDDTGTLCAGVAGHRGLAASPTEGRRLAQLLAEHEPRWSDLSPSALKLALVRVLSASENPVPFDALVAAVSERAGVREPRFDVSDRELPARTPGVDERLHRTQTLARVWEEVQELPLGQRTALLLNLRGAATGALLWLLPVLGVATIRQIAATLTIPLADFARLWTSLPLDDDAIGVRLGCTRQQVINLRMSARKRLANRLRDWHTPQSRSRQANLTDRFSS